MGRIEDLAEIYRRHIGSAWQRTIAGAQRVVIIVYDKELERTLRARKLLFETATYEAGHDWHEVDLSASFPEWMAATDYRDDYFVSPDDLQLKIDAEFTDFVADRVREMLRKTEVTENSVVAAGGLGTLFGFSRISDIVTLVEADIKGRLVLFFPGHYDNNNYRLLDARDGWNYLAVPITLHGSPVF